MEYPHERTRRTALNRAVEEMASKLESCGISVDFQKRIGTSPLGRFGFREGLTKEECKRILRGEMRKIELPQKLAHEIAHEKIAKKLQNPLFASLDQEV